MGTPHIDGILGDVAKTVLMPGDPLRAKFVAETYLQDIVQYNGIRGMYGYTGTYKGKKVSIQGSGMGMPSIGIYSYELYTQFGVENIIRIGTAGTFCDDLHIGDLIFGQGASTNSRYAEQYRLPGTIAPIADYKLLETAVNIAKGKDYTYKVGNILSSDTFYDDDPQCNEKWRSMGILGVEMEAAALYLNAAKLNKRALAILTVSDEIFAGRHATAEERQLAFTKMMEVALDTVLVID